jgi:hypothetical protein
VVRLAPRRHHQICREPAEEVRGHRQRPLLSRCPALDVVRAARHRAVLGRQGRQDLSRRQPAHQAGAVLGVDDPRGAGPPPGRHFPVGGVHPAEDDAPLAKVGFTQSYSYFTWRNHKAELIEYLTELTRPESRLYMRPNFFANTPDINPVYLQTGGRAGFQVRLVLAALLSTSTASTTASRSAKPRRFPARRSISTRRSSRSGSGTSTAPATSRTTSGSSTACAATTRPCGSSPT